MEGDAPDAPGDGDAQPGPVPNDPMNPLNAAYDMRAYELLRKLRLDEEHQISQVLVHQKPQSIHMNWGSNHCCLDASLLRLIFSFGCLCFVVFFCYASWNCSFSSLFLCVLAFPPPPLFLLCLTAFVACVALLLGVLAETICLYI